MHGKNICDVALSNLPSNAITEAIRNPVGRFHILRLSQPRPRSRKGAGDPGCRKVVQGGLVGDRAHLLRHSKFTALAVPKADGFNGSHDVHMFAGDCKDAAAARKMGS